MIDINLYPIIRQIVRQFRIDGISNGKIGQQDFNCTLKDNKIIVNIQDNSYLVSGIGRLKIEHYSIKPKSGDISDKMMGRESLSSRMHRASVEQKLKTVSKIEDNYLNKTCICGDIFKISKFQPYINLCVKCRKSERILKICGMCGHEFYINKFHPKDSCGDCVDNINKGIQE